MTKNDNAALARRIYELFSLGKHDEAIGYATDDVELVLYPFGQTFHGKEGFAQFMSGFTTAFPDLSITVTNQVADDAGVASEFTAVGTHTGVLTTPAGDVAPTGHRVEFVVCEVWTVRDGLLASLRNYQDAGAIMRQLGLA
ncbi:MAG: ester cyclase [Acidimicrobiales bacterium]